MFLRQRLRLNRLLSQGRRRPAPLDRDGRSTEALLTEIAIMLSVLVAAGAISAYCSSSKPSRHTVGGEQYAGYAPHSLLSVRRPPVDLVAIRDLQTSRSSGEESQPSGKASLASESAGGAQGEGR